MAYTSTDWWDSLSKADRDMFTRALEACRQHVVKIYDERNAQVLETMEKEFGVKITRLSPEEKAR